MEYREFSAKNLDDAITEACETLMVTSDRLDYEVISKGSSGFLGIAFWLQIKKILVKQYYMPQRLIVFIFTNGKQIYSVIKVMLKILI